MSTVSPTSAPAPEHELHPLRRQWWCFGLLGISLVVLGVICIGWTFPTFLLPSVKPTDFFGYLLLAAGIAQIIGSFWTGNRSGMLLHLLMGVLYTVVGLLIIDTPWVVPWRDTPLLTTLLTIFLIESGIFRIVGALAQRFHEWGWVLLNGGVTLLLG